jgi:hypothetical protein
MASTMPDGRLRLLFQPTDEAVYEPDFLLDAPLIRFVAYQDARRLSGWISLAADRLTDLLNAHDELALEEVKVAEFDDGRSDWADELVIRRADLVAVHASGPPGDASQWQHTEPHAILVRSGRYAIGGILHAAPDAEPLADLAARPPMVPLTDAWIEYRLDGAVLHRAQGTIIVNRERADSIRPMERPLR